MDPVVLKLKHFNKNQNSKEREGGIMKKYTKKELDKMSEYNLTWILVAEPKLINKINTNKMSGWNTVCLLAIHPGMVNKLDTSKIIEEDIHLLLSVQPELKTYFNKNSHSS